jgi:hypothetical protein
MQMPGFNRSKLYVQATDLERGRAADTICAQGVQGFDQSSTPKPDEAFKTVSNWADDVLLDYSNLFRALSDYPRTDRGTACRENIIAHRT